MLSMKFLTVLLTQLSIGLVYKIGVPTMCAMIVEHFITHPHIDDGFGRYPHVATFLITGLFSAVCAALVTAANTTEKDTMFAVTTRTCAAASVWWFIRLGIEQDQLFDAVVFYTIAFWLLVATIVALITIPSSSRAGGYVLYGTAAAIVVLFGLYTSGRRVLTLERQAGSVSATLDTYRWLGSRKVSERSAIGVTDVVYTHQSRRFLDVDDAIVIQGAQDEILLPFGYDSLSAIDRFLKSSEASLMLVEPTSSLWRMSLMWLIASAVLALGVGGDPLLKPPEGKLAIEAGKWIAGNFWLAAGLFIAASAGTLWHLKSVSKHARHEIEMLGFTVEEADLEVRGKPLLGGAWRVTAADPSIDDSRIRQLLPHLKDAPGVALDLSGSRVTDEGVRHLNDVDFLAMLELRGTEVTGEALAAFKDVHVRYLDVRDTRIRTTDIRRAEIGGLEYLLFSDSEFSGKSVNALLGLDRLKYVCIDTVRFSREDLKFWETEIDFEIEIPLLNAEKGPE